MRSPAVDSIADRVAEGLGRRCLEGPDSASALARRVARGDASFAADHEGAFIFGGRAPDSDPFLLVLLLLEAVAATGLALEGLAGDIERRHWPVRAGRRSLEARPEFLRERLRELQDNPPRRLGREEARGAAGGDNALKLTLRDGSWLLIRLERGGALARLDAGGQCAARVERTLDAGAALLLGGGSGRVL